MENTGLNKQAPRTELVSLLDSFWPNKLIYIHAPAGYGKTVSAQLWLEHMKAEKGAEKAWLSLDEYDNKPVDFCRRITLTLKNMQPDNSVFSELVSHPSFDAAPAEFTARAIDALSYDDKKYILALDDMHVIDNGEIISTLPVFIKRFPGNFTILLIGRHMPPDSLTELLVKGAMATIDVEALRFSKDEVKTFFSLNGYKLTEKQVDDVYASTGGWVMGLRALMLSEKGNYDIKVAGQYLEKFLKTDVWEKWDKKLRDFMMKTSVADELTPELCEALTDEAGSAEILAGLSRGNAFLRVNENGAYKFHDLFRDFLLNMLEREGKPAVNGQLRKCGDWFYGNGDYYKAALYYVKCKNYEGVAGAYSAMNKYSSKNNNMDTRISMIDFMELESIPSEIFDLSPVLYVALIFGYYLGGKADMMENAIDRSKEAYKKIKDNHPDLLQTFSFIYGLDPRQSLIEHTKGMLDISVTKTVGGKAKTTTLSQNLPFFHRSQRDYSEYVFNMDEDLIILRGTFGVFIGKEFDVLEDCIRAGLLYEQGKAEQAHEMALSAVAGLPTECASELKFCAMIILTATLLAIGQTAAAHKVLNDIDVMIERDKAFYLTANLHAFRYRLRLSEGDREAAREWLSLNGESTYEHLAFYKIFRHFTTARAYIVSGDYSMAILFLKKLCRLCEDYNRPLDTIEASILLAIAYWKKGRSSQAEALVILEQAINMAHGYGYTQVFAGEGAELVSMLQRIQKRIVQKDYAGDIPGAFTKSLYIAALAASKHSKGLTGGRPPNDLVFTNQQKTVMRLMCEGYGRKEIAEKIGLKPSGAKAHLTLIYKKLDVPGGVEAVMKIKELGILDE